MASNGYTPRLLTDYRDRVRDELTKEFGYTNPMQLPKLVKVVMNMGIGEGSRDVKMLEALRENLRKISGQRPLVTRARKSIANFKLREGMPIGCSVTLRGNRMQEFIDRLISVVIPRVRDFRGLSPRSFDGHGNFAMGVTEQLVFPEIHYDEVPQVQGMDIVIVTTAKTDEEGRRLLQLLGMPFRT